ncbi:MAG: polysaccharide deacetylase family protein [Anaerolineae bacterium]
MPPQPLSQRGIDELREILVAPSYLAGVIEPMLDAMLRERLAQSTTEIVTTLTSVLQAAVADAVDDALHHPAPELVAGLSNALAPKLAESVRESVAAQIAALAPNLGVAPSPSQPPAEAPPAAPAAPELPVEQMHDLPPPDVPGHASGKGRKHAKSLSRGCRRIMLATLACLLVMSVALWDVQARSANPALWHPISGVAGQVAPSMGVSPLATTWADSTRVPAVAVSGVWQEISVPETGTVLQGGTPRLVLESGTPGSDEKSAMLAIDRAVYDQYPAIITALADVLASGGAAPLSLAILGHETLEQAERKVLGTKDWIVGAELLREDPFVAVRNPQGNADDGAFSMAELAALASGQDDRYRLVVGDSGRAVRDLLGVDPAGDTSQATNWSEVKQIVATQEGTWALLPSYLVDDTVQELAVDGVPFASWQRQIYPLVWRIWLVEDPPLAEPVTAALRSVLGCATCAGSSSTDVAASAVRMAVPSQPADQSARFRLANLPTDEITATAVPTQVIYLTFDDGPSSTWTPQVMELLERYHAKATFFVIGQNAAKHPELVQSLIDAGHSVAHHTWSHRTLIGMDHDTFIQEIAQTNAVLAAPLCPCVRPPQGEIDDTGRSYADELGLEVIRWNVDSGDWRNPDGQAVADHIVQEAQPGRIVLMHDGGGDRASTVAALEIVLEKLSQQGYTFEALCVP